MSLPNQNISLLPHIFHRKVDRRSKPQSVKENKINVIKMWKWLKAKKIKNK